jgi:ABC-type polar amino acid transport system ATPase subunit
LSGGQRQRISVARALYQHTNVVFLVSIPDEVSLGPSLLTAYLLDSVTSSWFPNITITTTITTIITTIIIIIQQPP